MTAVVEPHVVDAITRLLVENEGMFRPPVQAAKLLAYIVALHHRGEPFPPRAEVAKLLGIGVPTIDAALSSRLAEGYLSIRVGHTDGNVKRRPSSLKLRFYIPSEDLLATVADASWKQGLPR